MPGEMKPCPHCGGRARYWDGNPDGSQGVYVFCKECGLRGPLTMDMTETAAIAAWNALPRKLRWTKEQPKAPGWYWYKLRANGPAHIVEFMMYRKRPREYRYGWGNYAEHLRGFFAGPIPDPDKEGDA